MLRTCAASCLAVAVLLGCSDDNSSKAKPQGGVDEPRCAMGKRWAGVHASWLGNAPIAWDAEHQRSLDMHPGRNCLGCHALSGNAAIPDLIVAGTIFSAPGQANDCYGLSDVEVLVTDATGTTYRMRSSASGNFRLKRESAPDFKFPYTAAIRANGREIVMPDPQVVGSCNFCHTRDGQLGSNGRIVAPAANSDAGVPAPDAGPDVATPDGPKPDGPTPDGPRPDVKPPRESGPPRDSSVDATRDTTSPDTTRDSSQPDQCTAGGFGASCSQPSDCCSRLCSGPPFNKTCR